MPNRNLPAQIGCLDDRRVVQPLLSGRRYTAALAGQFLERLAGWLVSVALIILVYRLTNNIATVAAIIFALVAPRLIVQLIGTPVEWRDPCRAATILAAARVPLVAALLLVTTRQDLLWGSILVGAIGTLNALADATQCIALPQTTARKDLGAISMILGRAEQLAMVAGGVLVAVLVALWSERAAFVLAVVALAGATALLAWSRGHSRAETVETRVTEPARPARPGLRSDVTMLIAGLFAGAVIGMGLRVMLVDIVVGELDLSEALYALLIGVVGFGALVAPPISIPRLLIRIRGELLTVASVVALAIAMAIIGVSGSVVLIALALAACGAIAVTNDLITTTITRRVVPDGQVEATVGLLGVAIVAGQVVALMAIAGLSQFWSTGTVLIVMSIFVIMLLGGFAFGPRLAGER